MADLAYWPADTSQPVLELTTGDLLRQAAADAGEQTALVEVAPRDSPSLSGADRTDRQWTYRELLAQAEQCAHWLLTRFAPGERITVWAPNIPEWITWGRPRAGGLPRRGRAPSVDRALLRAAGGTCQPGRRRRTGAWMGARPAWCSGERACGTPVRR
ncbi:AMP-binding protein [Actinophytocola sp.]|uniref:AMP-binding protein n=1 Tax=Actinophytocola sp. TaxID=1872138 RepID=UPI002ED35C48